MKAVMLDKRKTNLGTISERTDKDDEEKTDVEIEEDFEDILACAFT